MSGSSAIHQATSPVPPIDDSTSNTELKTPFFVLLSGTLAIHSILGAAAGAAIGLVFFSNPGGWALGSAAGAACFTAVAYKEDISKEVTEIFIKFFGYRQIGVGKEDENESPSVTLIAFAVDSVVHSAIAVVSGAFVGSFIFTDPFWWVGVGLAFDLRKTIEKYSPKLIEDIAEKAWKGLGDRFIYNDENFISYTFSDSFKQKAWAVISLAEAIDEQLDDFYSMLLHIRSERTISEEKVKENNWALTETMRSLFRRCIKDCTVTIPPKLASGIVVVVLTSIVGSPGIGLFFLAGSVGWCIYESFNKHSNEFLSKRAELRSAALRKSAKLRKKSKIRKLKRVLKTARLRKKTKLYIERQFLQLHKDCISKI